MNSSCIKGLYGRNIKPKWRKLRFLEIALKILCVNFFSPHQNILIFNIDSFDKLYKSKTKIYFNANFFKI